MRDSDLTAEIVTFRARSAVPVQEMTDAARALGPLLAKAPGFVSRSLSVDATGTWTDHVVWESAEQAHRAAEMIMRDAAAAIFMALIDMDSVQMTHAPIVVAQKAA